MESFEIFMIMIFPRDSIVIQNFPANFKALSIFSAYTTEIKVVILTAERVAT